MLEILFLMQLSKSIARIAHVKGRSIGWMKFMLIAMWLAGEFLGVIVGAAMFRETAPIYLLALVGAAAGAISAFIIAKNLTPLNGTGARGFAVVPRSSHGDASTL